MCIRDRVKINNKEYIFAFDYKSFKQVFLLRHILNILVIFKLFAVKLVGNTLFIKEIVFISS